MSEELKERQDHVVYGITTILVIVALTLGLDYQLSGTRYALQLQMLQQVGGGPGLGSDWTAVLVACAAYLVFRLVRPFPFTMSEGQAPAGALYWSGNFIITLAAAASATFLAWAVLRPLILAHYRTAGLALSIAMVAGFLLVEASLVRKSDAAASRTVYADAGLLSALLVLPACLAWLITISPGSGFGRLLIPLFRVDAAHIGAPLALAAGVFLLWWVSMPLRRRLRQRAFYRAGVRALWVFGLATYAMQAVIARRTPRSGTGEPDWFEELWAYAYSYPGSALLAMLVVWALAAGMLYVAQRKWSPA